MDTSIRKENSVRLGKWLANRKVQQIDEKRWRLVEDHLEPGEERRHNTPALHLGGWRERQGYLLLSDRAVYGAFEAMALPEERVERIPLPSIFHCEPGPRGEIFLRYRVNGGAERELLTRPFPSPLTLALYEEQASWPANSPHHTQIHAGSVSYPNGTAFSYRNEDVKVATTAWQPLSVTTLSPTISNAPTRGVDVPVRLYSTTKFAHNYSWTPIQFDDVRYYG